MTMWGTRESGGYDIAVGTLRGGCAEVSVDARTRPSLHRTVSGQRSVSAAGRAGEEEMVGRDRVRVDSVPRTVTAREEVRPMDAVTLWVLPLVFTVGRST